MRSLPYRPIFSGTGLSRKSTGKGLLLPGQKANMLRRPRVIRADVIHEQIGSGRIIGNKLYWIKTHLTIKRYTLLNHYDIVKRNWELLNLEKRKRAKIDIILISLNNQSLEEKNSFIYDFFLKILLLF